MYSQHQLQEEQLEIEQIVEVRPMAGHYGRYELLILWAKHNKQEQQSNTSSWEPFDQINRDAPDLVREFFRGESGLTYEEVLQSEIDAAAG